MHISEYFDTVISHPDPWLTILWDVRQQNPIHTKFVLYWTGPLATNLLLMLSKSDKIETNEQKQHLLCRLQDSLTILCNYKPQVEAIKEAVIDELSNLPSHKWDMCRTNTIKVMGRFKM
jgi:hypothetical protein